MTCLVDAPCSTGYYCPASGDCLVCSTVCDGVCRAKSCYGTDPDCDANGNMKECCGNGMCANAETCAGCPVDCKCFASYAGTCHAATECVASDGTCYYAGFSVDADSDGRSEICSNKVFTDPDTSSTLCVGKQTWTYHKHYNNAGTASCGINTLVSPLNNAGNYWCTASTRDFGYNRGYISGSAGKVYPGSIGINYNLPTTPTAQTLSFVYFANTTNAWAAYAHILQVDHPTGTWSIPFVHIGQVCNMTSPGWCYGNWSDLHSLSGLNFATSGTLAFRTFNISGTEDMGCIMSGCSSLYGCYYGCYKCRSTLVGAQQEKVTLRINEWWLYSKGTAWSWLSNTCCGDDPFDLVCSGVCVNKWTNINNCGACGVKCTGTTDTCVTGVCKCGTGPACASGTCVNGACV